MTFFSEKRAGACVYQKKVVPLRPILICGIVRMRVRTYGILGILLLCQMIAWANDTIPKGVQNTEYRVQTDSVEGIQNTEYRAQTDNDKNGGGKLKSPVHYQAGDSMVMMGNGTAMLHGKGNLKYENMELTSDYIRMNVDSSQIYAHGVWDAEEEE